MFTLVVEDLLVKYERQVALLLESFQISGTILAILGHNGAGKSTLIKTLLGLLAPQKGQLYALTENNRRLKPDADMAFCPENGAVFEDISVADYLKVWIRLKTPSDSLGSERVQRLLELFEAGPLLHKYGRELSKGQRRRIQSVVGFLIAPKLFLFDEPFDGLDVQKTAELADILESYRDRISFVISSHRMDVIERVADSGIVLADGKIVAKGQINDLSTQLAGKSFAINGGFAAEKEAAREMARTFSAYLTHIGDQVVLTGPDISLDKLQNFLISKNLDRYSPREFKPTLTDAMGYHLHSRRK